MVNSEERHCLECGTKLFGRADQKFCSDACRNTYNNRQNSDANNYVRNVNNALRKNRRVLNALCPDEKIKVKRSLLIQKGFSFQFYTNTYQTKAGDVYYFCYELGYLPLEGEEVLIVRRDNQ